MAKGFPPPHPPHPLMVNVLVLLGSVPLTPTVCLDVAVLVYRNQKRKDGLTQTIQRNNLHLKQRSVRLCAAREIRTSLYSHRSASDTEG